jgi:hypothetical protein
MPSYQRIKNVSDWTATCPANTGAWRSSMLKGRKAELLDLDENLGDISRCYIINVDSPKDKAMRKNTDVDNSDPKNYIRLRV